MFNYECYFITDVGKVRQNNEDNFYLNGTYKVNTDDLRFEKYDLVKGTGLFAVCDGMGGEEFGEFASLYAVETLGEYQSAVFSEYCDEYIEKANNKICNLIKENNGVRSGTTLALVNIKNGKLKLCNIGDSRIYVFRNGKLIQLSEDHTKIAQMIKMGLITPEEAPNHRYRHAITQHLGIFPEEFIIQPYKGEEINLQINDIFLLCSDGLTDMLTDEEIENILSQDISSKQLSEQLVNMALNNGGKDNVTVGIIKVVEKRNFLSKLWRRKG